MRAGDRGLLVERRVREGARSSRIGVGTASLVLLLFQFACAFSGFSPSVVPPEERAAYDAAMGNLPANPEAATVALENFLATYPRSLLADDAAEQLSQLAFAAGLQEDGMRWLGRILSRYPKSDRAPSARLRLAQLEYARDRRAAARRLLEPLRLEDLDRAGRRAALRLRIALARTPAERMLQLALLRQQIRAEASERGRDPITRNRLESRLAAVDRDIKSLISKAASAELEEMLSELRDRPPSAEILLELARRALDAGQLDLATRWIEGAGSSVTGDVGRGELRLLTERLAVLREAALAEADLPPLRELAERARPETRGARGTLGVVLPLSGDFASFGKESLHGILLAAHVFSAGDGENADRFGENADGADSAAGPGRGHGDEEIRVVVRDSGGDPARAAAAVRELAADPDLVAIVGPIFSAESLAAAEAAEAVGVPLVTLSTREEVPSGRSEVFRTRTTPGDEVGALVRHAFEELGATRFAVLYPRTRYGRGMRKLYWDAVMARGGTMVAASSYDPEATDFSGPIRDMIGYRFLTRWERKALVERKKILRAARRLEPEDAALLRTAAYSILGPEVEPLPPIVDFDVLFIPDTWETIALIAPALAFHEVQGVRLLGTSDWVDEGLLRVARRHVSGAVISAPFHAESDIPLVEEFVAYYRAVFDEEPDAYAAQAYDATNLVLVQLASGRTDREDLREGLLDTRAFPGATGVLTMRPDGNARRRPFLLGVSRGRFRSLD